MSARYTYSFIIVAAVVLLVTLLWGTLIMKEGYDDYLDSLLKARGYQVSGSGGPGSSGYYLASKYRCSDGSVVFDHENGDCSKPLLPPITKTPGAAESCTVTKNSAGEDVDSCKSINQYLKCNTATKTCDTVISRELGEGQICKYPNECLSGLCQNNKCTKPNAPGLSELSSTALQSLGSNFGSGSESGVSNLDDFFRLIKDQTGTQTNEQALNAYFDSLSKSNTSSSGTSSSSGSSSSSSSTSGSSSSSTSDTTKLELPPVVSSSGGTSTTTANASAKRFYDDVKRMMMKDVKDTVSSEVNAWKAQGESCDSCC